MKKIFLLMCFLGFNSFAFTCSIFTYVSGNQVFFCGNEDWTARDPAFLFVPSPDKAGKKYDVLLLGWNSNLPNYPQAGVNSQGLCFDWASVPHHAYVADQKKESLSVNDTLLILQQCATVAEVLSFLESYNFPNLADEHIMFADKTGASCVIEYSNGKRHNILSNKNQYITNFNLTNKDAGWYPCGRFSKLESVLSKQQAVLNHSDLTKLLDAVHQNDQYPTVYSYIIDVTAMKIFLYRDGVYTKEQQYNFNDFQRNGTRILITQ